MRNPERGEIKRSAFKTLPLFGMWRAANPSADSPSVNELRAFHAELIEVGGAAVLRARSRLERVR